MKIVLEHLTKKFPARGKKGEEVTAVRDFTFEIPDGSLIGLLGPSGCGKSTALNLLCGLEAPTEGKIYFGDTDVTDMPPELRGVGMVFQNYALYPHLTVRQNILFPLENIKGKLCADKGYIGQVLFENLFLNGIQLVTKVKNNMRNSLMSIADKILLRKRALIETVNDELKNIAQIEHSRHRSFSNFIANSLSAIAAYCFFEKKPAIDVKFVNDGQLAIF